MLNATYEIEMIPCHKCTISTNSGNLIILTCWIRTFPVGLLTV